MIDSRLNELQCVKQRHDAVGAVLGSVYITIGQHVIHENHMVSLYQGLLGQFRTTKEGKWENNQWVSHKKLSPLYISVKWESLPNLGPPVCSTWVMVLDCSRYVEILVSIWS